MSKLNPIRLPELVVAASLLLVGATAQSDPFYAAQDLVPNPDRGKQIFVTCVGCHEPTGWGSPSGAIPQLAGQYPRIIMRQLAEIRDGMRPSPIMKGFATPDLIGGPQGIADAAHYIASWR